MVDCEIYIAQESLINCFVQHFFKYFRFLFNKFKEVNEQSQQKKEDKNRFSAKFIHLADPYIPEIEAIPDALSEKKEFKFLKVSSKDLQSVSIIK